MPHEPEETCKHGLAKVTRDISRSEFQNMKHQQECEHSWCNTNLVEGGGSALPFVRHFYGSASTCIWQDDDGTVHVVEEDPVDVVPKASQHVATFRTLKASSFAEEFQRPHA